MGLKVLLVEDDPHVRSSVADTLVEEGADVVTAESAEAALNRVGECDPDLVLSDIRMPGLTGLDLLRELRTRAASTDVVLMTAYEDMPTVAEAMREGAVDFLVKPVELARLRAVLERVGADRAARSELVRAGTGAGQVERMLVGRDPGMLEVYKRIGRVASAQVNALIRGETGTGKELVARAIHESASTRDEPFVAVNCTALPETLLESELFGHVKGAFTGAAFDRRGRFALAGRGTVFLDEIGDTSPAFQAKLLRVLETGEYTPVGGEEGLRTGARVLAATHRDLEALVREGTFREDLYYRLRVVEIVVPPLRERLGDLPELARHLVGKVAHRIERPPVAITEEAMARLLLHDWPGNVRELEHCLTRAVVMTTGGILRPEHLEVGEARGGHSEAGAQPAAEPGPAGQLLPTLAEMEGRHLERAMALTGGNKTRAAELLGVSKPTLYRMLERHRPG